jgi:hypothetical protein
MWETFDFRDQALVRFAQRDLWREVARDQLARDARAPRRSVLGALAARISGRRTASTSSN